MTRYGYGAVALGVLVEGDTVLFAGGVLAGRGVLMLPGVVVAAFAGALLSDQTTFWLGRRYGRRLLERSASWQRRLQTLHGWLHNRRLWLIFGFRFFYGVRSVAPMLLGTSDVPYAQFIALNALGAATWASLVATLGYGVGRGFGGG